jgi:hypothetical protein
MKEPIASTELLVVPASGRELTVVATIGRPYRDATGEWRCRVELAGLQDRLPDMAGADSLQALCMAASLIRSLLEDVGEKGGRVLDPSSRADYPIAAMFGRVGAPPAP